MTDRRHTGSKTPSYSGIPERGACRDDGDEAHGHHDEAKEGGFQGAHRPIPVGLKNPQGGKMNKVGSNA